VSTNIFHTHWLQITQQKVGRLYISVDNVFLKQVGHPSAYMQRKLCKFWEAQHIMHGQLSTAKENSVAIPSTDFVFAWMSPHL
jgi:hypothetical protein